MSRFEAASGFFGQERRMLRGGSAASTSCTGLNAKRHKLYLCRCWHNWWGMVSCQGCLGDVAPCAAAAAAAAAC